MDGNGFIHPSQHAYRSHHSTTTALLTMYDSWLEADGAASCPNRSGQSCHRQKLAARRGTKESQDKRTVAAVWVDVSPAAGCTHQRDGGAQDFKK